MLPKRVFMVKNQKIQIVIKQIKDFLRYIVGPLQRSYLKHGFKEDNLDLLQHLPKQSQAVPLQYFIRVINSTNIYDVPFR